MNEEKRYPDYEEESYMDCCQEPVVGYGIDYPHNEFAISDNEEDDYDISNIPFSGPETREEAIARIEEAEKELENGESFSHEEIMKMMWDRIYSYAS